MGAGYEPGSQIPLRSHLSPLKGTEIPHERLTSLQKGCDDPPAGYVPPLFGVHMFGLSASSGEDRVGMEAIVEISQRLA